jgi:Plasmid pRiA4b ORF-3-like protein.
MSPERFVNAVFGYGRGRTPLIRVTLIGTSPPIRRRLLVPSGLTLAQLHDLL